MAFAWFITVTAVLIVVWRLIEHDRDKRRGRD